MSEKQILKNMIDLSKIYYALIDLQLIHKINIINQQLVEYNKKGKDFFNKYPDILEEYNMLFGEFFVIKDNEIKMNKLTKFIDDLETLISNECKHEYIYDLIDITPDRSQTIQYCRKCNKTK